VGSLQAKEMREQASHEVALTWHLQHNHYPPIPLMMIPIAQQAIEAANEHEWDREIEMPDEVEHKVHGNNVPACVLIDYMNLQDFLDSEEEIV